MKIIIAPDKFKDSLSSYEVADAIEEGVRRVFSDAQCIQVPIADGGEGTVEALVRGMDGSFVELEVHNPLGEKIVAKYGMVKHRKLAIIEMAKASGLALLKPSQRNPLKTSTYGTGELIKDALNQGCRKFIVGIGGSATNDAGMGMMRALGVRFYDAKGNELQGLGEDLSKIATIDTQGLLPEAKLATFLVACDVENPLYGKEGAAYVYAPQKGATPKMVEELDQGLKHFNKELKEQLGVDVAQVKGAGAAGGLGGGFLAFLNAELRSGIEIVLDELGFVQKLKGADLVITAEGKLDIQTTMGKAPIGVAQYAKEQGLPLVAIAGSIDQEAIPLLHQAGIDALFSIMNRPMILEEALDSSLAKELITQEVEEIVRLFFLRG